MQKHGWKLVVVGLCLADDFAQQKWMFFLEIFQTSLDPFLSEKSVANFQENIDISVFHGFILWSNVASNLQHNSLDGK